MIVSNVYHGMRGLKEQNILNLGKSQPGKLAWQFDSSMFWQLMASGKHVKLISKNIPLTSTDLGITGFTWVKMMSTSLKAWS